MASVLQLQRVLKQRPVTSIPRAAVHIRNYRSQQDIGPWLALYHAALADRGARPWQRADFHREVVGRRGWRPEWMWLAEPVRPDADRRQLVASVCLILRGGRRAAWPVVHWLIVHPAWRRRGIASHLVGQLAAAAWDEGYRRVGAETLSSWKDAASFYRAAGFVPMRTV